MTKTYCDVCKKEITTPEQGVFLFVEKKNIVISKEQPKAIEFKYDLCGECVLVVKKGLNL